MRLATAVFAAALAIAVPASADGLHGTLYKNPSCGCCAAWGQYLRENGFEVDLVNSGEKVAAMKQSYAVPLEAEGCHSFVIEDYIVEGHVPVGAILKLLEERPDIRGITLPGMPSGSPGMGGTKEGPLTVYTIGDGEPEIFYVE